MWNSLKKPFFVLAPMEDVTDTVFRRVVNMTGRPEIYFTEFTSVEGFMSRGRPKVAYRFERTEQENPLIAQIWGLKPENFLATAKWIAEESDFAGIDLNMGCPKEDVIKRGACAGLIRNPTLAAEIIAATREGAGKLPVSVKTRIGDKENQIDSWVRFILEQKPAALTIHFRTILEMSKVPAHWDLAPQIVALKNEISPKTVVIGNGDVISRQQGLDLAAESGIDGIMVGRGIFHDPWIFSQNPPEKTKEVRLQLLLDHARLFNAHWGRRKNFHVLKRYFKIYSADFDGAGELRENLMLTETLEDVETALKNAGFDVK